jgi:hypothetical protein
MAQQKICKIKTCNKKIHIGYFKKLEDAIEARQQAEIKYFKEYRRKI